MKFSSRRAGRFLRLNFAVEEQRISSHLTVHTSATGQVRTNILSGIKLNGRQYIS
jgi:hypothetical protein